MAAGMRGGLGIASWLFLAGAILLMFFVVLGGVSHSTPLNKVHFLQADTSKITGARPISRWNYFYVCGADNRDCGDAVPALPFGYAWIGNTAGVPSALLGKHGKGTTSQYYYYIWRFGWVFYLIALVFAVLSLFTGLVSFHKIGSGISSLLCFIATGFMTLAASLMTVEFVKARDVFNKNNMSASLGKYAFGFTWAALVCLCLATLGFFGGCCVGRSSSSKTQHTTNDGVADRQTSFFRRNRSQRQRGSFVDNESQRRVVKEEY
ncbi:MAG: hypothetical protein M1818_001577 [Claussenomyces sp. TS43310]|nr:MAG: hypothetical protein M1818_001577 [Claussenomyces sp. TS43310]